MLLQDAQNEAKFDRLMAGLGTARGEFFAHPIEKLTEARIPLVPAVAVPIEQQELFMSHFPAQAPLIVTKVAERPNPLPEKERAHIDVHWWGLTVVMNERLTRDITEGIVAAPALSAVLSSALVVAGAVAQPVAAAVGGAFAAAFLLKIAQIKITDNGKGVNWPISWPQWAGVVAAVPTGIAGITAAIIVFIHPFRN